MGESVNFTPMTIRPLKLAAPSGKDVDAWFGPGLFALFLIAVIAARCPEVLLSRATFFYRDFGIFGYPLAHYQRECFWRGEVPLWDPLNFCGIPFLAQWNTMTFYPPALFYLIFPLQWSLGVFNLGHLCFGGMGMYFLARRWTGRQLAAAAAGTVFAFNGLMWNALMWPNDIAALGWMPWVVLALERAWREGGRTVTLAALAAGMQILAGAPEITLLTWAFIGLLWLAQCCRGAIPRLQSLGRLLLAGGLAGGLAAAQLLPFVQLLLHSQRSTNYGNSAWSMPSWGWANFLVPLFHCERSILGVFFQNEQQWTASYYMGVGTIALAVLAVMLARRPRVYWLAALAAGAMILAMGDNAHVYSPFRAIFPPLGFMRFPIKIIVLTVFTLPLLVAFAVNANFPAQPAEARSLRRHFLIVGAVLALAIGGILIFARHHPLPKESWQVTRESGLSRATFLVLILGAGWAAARARTKGAQALAGVALLLLLALDAMTHSPNQSPTVTTAVYGPLGIDQIVQARYGQSRAMLHPWLQKFMANAATPDPMAYYTGQRRALHDDVNLIDAIPTPSGFFSLELGTSVPVMSLLNDLSHPFPEPLADFVGVSQITLPDTSFTWVNRTNYLPLATAGQKPIFAGNDETLKALGSADFDPRGTVYLPVEARQSVIASNRTTAVVTSRECSTQRVSLDVQAGAPALVVVAQAFYAPWHAYVDGARVKLWPANVAFQALEVPAGHHEVVLAYEDTWFELGLLISAASLAGIATIWIRAGKHRRRG
jgi:hypothetical protein